MTEGMLVEMQLRDPRKSRHFTQVEVAQALSVEQTAVPKLEHSEDMFVSTLLGTTMRGYVYLRSTESVKIMM